MQVKFRKKERNFLQIVCFVLTIVILLLFTYNLLLLGNNQAFADNSVVENIQIATAADLYKISLPENSQKNFVLTNDIDLKSDTSWYEYVSDNENGWNPIAAVNNSGKFDGNGHKICNLKINRPNIQYVGLFSVCSLTIINLYVESENLEGTEAIIGGDLTGLICGKLIGSIENVSAKGTVRSDNVAGGLVGQAQGVISNSDFEGRVFANSVGGLVGNSISAKILNSYAYADLTGKIIGGLIGIADYGVASGDIRNILAFGTLTNSEDEGVTRVGGLVGIKDDRVNIVNGYAMDVYPCVAQGNDNGIKSLSKFDFVEKDNFKFDFDTVWYLTETSLFPKIRHIIIIFETNSNYIEESQLVNTSRCYNDEILTINVPEKFIVKSILVNGQENLENLLDNKLKICINENTVIKITLGFLVEFATIITGEGTVSAEKDYYQEGEIIKFNIIPDDGYKLNSVNVRFKNQEIILENDDGTYFYKIKGDINEGDQFVAYVSFVAPETNGLQWWAIMLIVFAAIAFLVIAVTITIFINKRFKNRRSVK